MAQLWGTWAAPTISGPQTVTVNGIEFGVPEDAKIKIVYAGKIDVAHVKVWDLVIVLSARGQLVESEAEARLRASIDNWRAVSGS